VAATAREAQISAGAHRAAQRKDGRKKKTARSALRRRRLATGREKFLQQGSGLRGEHARRDFDLMIQLGVGEDLEAGPECAPFQIICAVDDPGYAGLNDGARTHGARLDGDVKSGAGETIVADDLRHFADNHDFGVRGGVITANRAIARPGDDGACMDHYGPDGNFAGFGGSLRFGERELHEVKIVWHASVRIAWRSEVRRRAATEGRELAPADRIRAISPGAACVLDN